MCNRCSADGGGERVSRDDEKWEKGEEKSGEDRSSEVDPRCSYSLLFYIFVCERPPQNR